MCREGKYLQCHRTKKTKGVPIQILRARGRNILDSSPIFSSIRPKLALSSSMTEITTDPILVCNIIEFAAHVIEYFD